MHKCCTVVIKIIYLFSLILITSIWFTNTSLFITFIIWFWFYISRCLTAAINFIISGINVSGVIVSGSMFCVILFVDVVFIGLVNTSLRLYIRSIIRLCIILPNINMTYTRLICVCLLCNHIFIIYIIFKIIRYIYYFI